MAQIKKRIGKTGKISYLIRVSSGYDIYGRQIKRSMTWTPPPGMTEKKADKQARLAVPAVRLTGFFIWRI